METFGTQLNEALTSLNYPCLARRLSQTTCEGPSQPKLGTGSLKHTLPFMAFPPYSHCSLQLLWKGSCTNSEAYHCKRYRVGEEIGQQKGVGYDLDWVRRRESHLKGAEDQLLAQSRKLGWLPGAPCSAEPGRQKGRTQL